MARVQPVIVVAAVIEREGRFLIALRPEGTHLAGHWEFPGGKVHAGETHEAALRRELGEELGVDGEVGELVHRVTHEYPEGAVSLFFYRCTIAHQPRALNGQQIQWAPREDLAALPFPDADRELVDWLAGRDRIHVRDEAGTG